MTDNLKSMKKALLIFAAIILGGLFPFGHAYTFLIRYNLMVMLFFSFLGIQANWQLFNANHFKVLAINIFLPLFLYTIIQPFSSNFALIAFVVTIIPTAAAAPVIAQLLQTNVGKVTVSVILSTPIIAILLPFLLTYFLKIEGDISLKNLVYPVLSLVFLPLITSQIIRNGLPKLKQQIEKLEFISFPLFLANIVIACGNASNFVQNNQEIIGGTLIGILLIVSFLCVLQFQIGAFVGRKSSPLTYSLALGRKNTMIGLWVSLTYFNPIVALGPIFYIILHNIYNSYQIWQVEKTGC